MTQLKVLITIALLIVATSAQANQTKCRVLALEGGGDKGAYQAGALNMFLQKLGAEEIQYDVYSGVSAGSLNSAALSLFDKGDEQNQIQFLLDTWNTIQASNVYENWNILGPAYALFEEISLYNTAPLKAYLQNIFKTHSIKRKINIGTTDANNGSFVRLKGDLLSQDDQISAVLASSAIPALFPPIQLGGQTYVDGGTVMNLDIGGGVLRCMEMGFDRSQIVVDAILCSGAQLEQTGGDYDKTYQAIGRLLQILSYQHALDDLLHARYDFGDILFRYIVVPTVKLESGLVPLNFDATELKSMIAQGEKDASDVIDQGVNLSFKQLAEAAQKIRDHHTGKGHIDLQKPEIKNLISQLIKKNQN